MSVKAMAVVFQMDLPPREKLIMLALADHASDDGSDAYPSQSTMTDKTGYGTTTIKKVYKVLMACRLISRNGKKFNNVPNWTINLRWKGTRKQVEAEIIKLDTRVSSHTGDGLPDTRVSSWLDTRVSTNHPLTIIKPSAEISDSQPDKASDWPYLDMVIRITGLLPTDKDIETVKGWEKSGAVEPDFMAALAWRKENGKKPIKTISQLAGGVETSRLRRIQSNNGGYSQNSRNKTDIIDYGN